MKIVAATGSTLAGALALMGVLAVPSGAQAAVLTIDENVYSTSAVQSPAGSTLAVLTVTDLAGGGVSVVDFWMSRRSLRAPEAATSPWPSIWTSR